MDLRAHALLRRTADEMQALGDDVTIRTVWMAWAERCPMGRDDQVLGTAAGLPGLAREL